MPVRTGQNYIKSLKVSPREVWIDGHQIEDVTQYATFIRPISAIARLYDMHHSPDWSGLLTYPSPKTGDPVAVSFLAPTNRAELLKRRVAIKALSDATFGLMGRSPDFLNSAVMAFATAKDFFAQAAPRYASNIVNYYEHCRENDLFLAHATINPQVDRSKSPGEQSDPFVALRLVQESEEGILVRGAKMISTLAPIADELIVFPLPGLKTGDEPYALAFAIPLSTPGLRLICREPFDRGDQSYFNHPLSSRYEEMDAACIFDDVLVPWERVFLYGNLELANTLYQQTNGRHHTGHQGIVRGLSKAELLVGVAIQLAEMVKVNTFLHVQEVLGELLGFLELIEGAILLAEEKAFATRWRTLCPAIEPIQALRYHFPRMYSRMVEVIQMIGAGSLLSSPVEKDFEGPIAGDIERYFRGASSSAYDRVRLLKLAWDIIGSEFGQRQVLYEHFHAGDPVRIAAAQYMMFDSMRLKKIVSSVLSE
jgi:4-hydroxyphenylacetate 3-monooxygenase/anthranilate 3-monooxygenase (FAD)/4-hydroxyphenylacetate 3-monooxygenase